MAYIVPNSDIRLLSDVPIDKSYRHTLWFDTPANQEAYFIGKSKRYFPKCTYTRATPGYIKVQASADDVRDCNYMMYRNTAYSNKWFYAFIINVVYISNNVCGIVFVIDQLQTWFFDMHLSECFIDRQHAVTDNPGDNLIPENLETGEYMYVDNNLDWSKTFTGYDVIVYTTFSSSLTADNKWVFAGTQGTYRWGIYTGLNMRVFRHIENADTVASINSFLSAAVEEFGIDNGIISLIMIPSDSLDDKLLPTQIPHSIPKITSLDYYTPKNKKLLTYPYCFIEAQNCEGATAAFRQEYFGGTNPAVCQFMITFNITTMPVALCVPINYKGSEYNYSEGLFINNFSQCSYNTDMFKAYMAQSLVGSTMLKAADNVRVGSATIKNDIDYVARAMYNGFTGKEAPTYSPINPEDYKINANWIRENAAALTFAQFGLTAGAAAASLPVYDSAPAGQLLLPGATGGGGTAVDSVPTIDGTIYNIMQGVYSHAIAAPHNTGANSPDYFTSNRLKGFWLFHRTITNEFARKIDSYFTRFGYAQHNIAVPNIHTRNRFTYIKTVDCVVHGDLPADAGEMIQNIFDSGITFWADHDNVGNYSLDNPIYTGG